MTLTFGPHIASSAAEDRTVGVEPERWKELFDELSRSHEGWLATLSVFKPETGTQVLARQLPFAGIVQDERRRSVSLLLGPMGHSIAGPCSVSVRLGSDGAEKALYIEAGDGARATLEFRSALPSVMVDGIAQLPVET